MSLEKAKELYLKAWKSEILTERFVRTLASVTQNNCLRWLLSKSGFIIHFTDQRGRPDDITTTVELYSFRDTELWEFMVQIRSLSPEEFEELSNTLGRRVYHPKHDKHFKNKF